MYSGAIDGKIFIGIRYTRKVVQKDCRAGEKFLLKMRKREQDERNNWMKQATK